MQPYFLPYIGYWQLMYYVDSFVVYDDIKYTKKGWINRNRFLLNGKPETFSLPIKKDSDFLDIRDRRLSSSFIEEKNRLMRRLNSAYRDAPYSSDGKSLLEEILNATDDNLFNFIFQSIKIIHAKLGLSCRLIPSSTLNLPRHLKGEARVISICKELDASEYINPIGGMELYSSRTFSAEKIRLYFQKTRSPQYIQYKHAFVPNLSILDGIMFLGFPGVKNLLSEMDLIEGVPSSP